MLRAEANPGEPVPRTQVPASGYAKTLSERLRRPNSSDFGWGYYAGKSGRLEPTAWTALALWIAGDRAGANALHAWPAADGLLLEHAGGQPNYAFHGLALLAMEACGVEHVAGNASLIAGLHRVRGIALEQMPGARQDNTLQAWSWIAGTFSWVEPTGWCLLALKKLRRTRSAQIDNGRIADAERLLINRACRGGGWNYGNADVLGQDLRPYVPTTAVALLAMQDRRSEATVQSGLSYLEAHAAAEGSGSALALAILALRAFGRDHGSARRALEQQLPVTLEIGNQAAIAAAAYALGTEGAHDAFTL